MKQSTTTESDKTLHIFCTSDDKANGSYDAIETDYHTRLNLRYPVSLRQTIHLEGQFNNTHNVSYSQICEVDNDFLYIDGFISGEKVSHTHKTVRAKVISLLFNFFHPETGENQILNVVNKTPPIPKWFSPTTTHEPETRTRSTTTSTTPSPYNQDNPLSDGIFGNDLFLNTIQFNPSVRSELERELRTLTMDEEEEKIPDSYHPQRSNQYQSKVQALVGGRSRDISRRKHRFTRSANGDNSDSHDHRIALQILRKRLFRMENKMKKLIFLFKVSLKVKSNNIKPLCLQIVGLKTLIRCINASYDSVMEYSLKEPLIRILVEILDLEIKIDVDTDLYDSYLNWA